MKSRFIKGMMTVCMFFLSIITYGQDEWLFFPSAIPKNWLNIGNLSVTGDSITVEALIDLIDTSSTPPKDIVSKHSDPPDCNYLLRHYKFELTTSSGYKALLNPKKFCADSIYHVAGTYDGDSMKYYVNGIKVASVHWTGILVQNSLLAAIGNISDAAVNEQYFGYLDEVRIWKIARSQADIQNNMYNLPNPTSQYGLLAYYKFDGNYDNIQGNSAYDGVPEGSQLEDIVNPYFNGTISNLPVTVSVTISVSNNSVCQGTSVTFTANPVNGGNLPFYQWKVNGINAGTNSTTFTYVPVNGNIVTCTLTSSFACSFNNPAISNPITMVVNPNLLVNVSINASSNPVCSGTSVTFTATPTNGGISPFYQWQVNGINSGPDSQTYTYVPVNGDIVTCILISSDNCTTNNPATSNSITMVVNDISPVSITINPSSNPVCSGTSVIFTATTTNGGTAPSYQWQVNGINAGTNDPIYTYTPSNGDIVTCVLTSNATCPTGNPATSNSITMVVNNNLAVSITISASVNPVCSGNSVTYTSTPANGGANPSYQWQVNGINTGPNSSAYIYNPINGDIITCILTSSANCATNNPATSNSITMVVNNNLPVSILINESSNPVCSGTSVTYTATPTNGGINASYQWKVNGVNAGTNNPAFTYLPNNGDIITCILTSDTICPTGNPATSNAITMTVNPNLPVNLSIVASENPSCQGISVTYTATAVNGGATPVYQWQVNGVNAGSGIPTYTYIPSGGDIVTCILTSSLSCNTGNPATSNSINMVVNSNFSAGDTIDASSNPFCPGIPVTFTATPVNGGTNPTYQWIMNGLNVGTNSPTYSYHPNNGDSIRCMMTSNLSCVINNPTNSAEIIMNELLAPSVTFTACFDTITTLIAKPIKLKGGIPLGGTYMGTGVNSMTGIFTPSVAGTGTKTITYTYTNSMMCSASKTLHIIVDAALIFTCGNNLTDIRDNKVYPTVHIGSQCWMASNLNFGTVLVSTQDQRDNCIWEKYCYNDNPVNCTNLGGLYQWDEIMQYDDTPADQGFCPPGWHIPTENDWNTLFSVYTNNGFAGSPLKYSGFSGFNASLAGANYYNTSWDFKSSATFFWSSTLHSPTKVWAHGMNDPDPSVSAYPATRVSAFSVRCMED